MKNLLVLLALASLAVPGTASAQVRPGATVDVGTWPRAVAGRPEGVLNPRVVRGHDGGLLALGGILLGVGLATTTVGIILGATDDGGGDGDVGYKVIAPQGAWPSVAGIILLVFAGTNFTEDFVPSATVGTVSFQLHLDAPDAEVGTSLRVTF